MTLTDTKHVVPTKLKLIRAAFKVGGVIAPALAARYALNIFRTPRKRNIPEGAIFEKATWGKVAYQDFHLTTYTWDGDGQTVLLVHGWESSAERVAVLVEPLLAAGYRVVAFDGPAHGNSEGKYADPLEFAEAVVAVANSLGHVHGIIAHSLGAGGTMFALAQYPDLDIDRVVIIGSPEPLRRYPNLFAETVQLPDSVYGRMQGMYEKRIGAHMTETDVSLLTQRIRQQGLVIHDRKDLIVPFADAEAIVASWPNAQHYYTEGYGHRRILKRDDVAEQIVTFLQG